MADEKLEVAADERLKVAVSADIPQIYFNGFANALTTGDIMTVLEKNGRPIAVLNMSFTMAKTLSQKLGYLVAVLEEKAGREMLSTDDVAALALDTSKQAKESK